MSLDPEEVFFDPVGLARIKQIEMDEDGEDGCKLTVTVTMTGEQARMAFKRFLVNQESLLVRLEKGI